jgi:hypothetical protein
MSAVPTEQHGVLELHPEDYRVLGAALSRYATGPASNPDDEDDRERAAGLLDDLNPLGVPPRASRPQHGEHGMNIPITVFVLQHTHDRHGEDITVHANETAAKSELHTHAVNNWTDLHCVDGADCDVDGCTGVPGDPFDLSRDTAIDAFFDHRAHTETYSIVDHEVEVPSQTVFAAWGQRVREAASRVGDGLLANGQRLTAARQDEQS